MTPDHLTARRVATVSLVVMLAGCAVTTPPSAATPSAASVVPSVAPAPVTPTATATPAATAAPTASATPVPTPRASCVDSTLASMSEAQRIGQVFMIGLMKDRLDAAERSAVADYHVGSFAFTTQSKAGVTAIRAITDAVQGLATKKATDGVRFFVAANQEGGLIQRRLTARPG